MRISYLFLGILWGSIANVILATTPLHIHINKIKSPVVVGESIHYTVEISNTTSKKVRDVQLVVSLAFGLDMTTTGDIASEEADEDAEYDYIEEDGTIFELLTIEAGSTVYYELECEVFNQYFDEEEENAPVTATVYYLGRSGNYQKISVEAEHFEVHDAAYLEMDVENEEDGEYVVSVSNIGPVDLEKVGAVIRYSPYNVDKITVHTTTTVAYFYNEGTIFVYPRKMNADPDGEEEGWVFTVKATSDEEEPFTVALLVGDFSYPSQDDADGITPPVDSIASSDEDEPEDDVYFGGDDLEDSDRTDDAVAKNPEEEEPVADVEEEEPVAEVQPQKIVRTLYLEKATYAKRKKNKKKWDFGFGKTTKPDSFVVVSLWVNGNWEKQHTTKVQKNNLQPSWQQSTSIKVEEGSKIKFEVFDKDLRKNDAVGSSIQTITADQFKQDSVTISFDSVESFEYTLREE